MKDLIKQVLTDIEKMSFLFDNIGNRQLLHGEDLYIKFKKNTPVDSPLNLVLSKKGKIRNDFYEELNAHMQNYLCDGLFYLPFIFPHFDQKMFNQIWECINKEKFFISNRIFLNPYTIFKINEENITDHALLCLKKQGLLYTERVIEFKPKKACFKASSVSDIEPVIVFQRGNEVSVNMAEYDFLTKLNNKNIELFKGKGILLRTEKIVIAMDILKADINKDLSADRRKDVLLLLTKIEKNLLNYQTKDSADLKNNYIQRL